MKKCERCNKEYKRDYKKEIVVMPNVCKECDIFLSNFNRFKLIFQANGGK